MHSLKQIVLLLSVFAVSTVFVQQLLTVDTTPPKIIFRFDDSLQNTYDVAYPVFKERGWPAVVSVITNKVGSVFYDEEWRDKQCMNLTTLHTLRDEGWQLVSYSVSHWNFHQVTEATAHQSIRNSRLWMIRHLSVDPQMFVYPYSATAHETVASHYYPHINDEDYVFRGVEVVVVHSIVAEPEGPWEMTLTQFMEIVKRVELEGCRVVTFKDC